MITACLGHLLAADQRVERGAEAGDVGVVADQSAAFAGERVDCAGGLGLLGQSVDHRTPPAPCAGR